MTSNSSNGERERLIKKYYPAMQRGHSNYCKAGMHGEMNLLMDIWDEIEPLILADRARILSEVEKILTESKESASSIVNDERESLNIRCAKTVINYENAINKSLTTINRLRGELHGKH